jgi:POT family proton-dependent oligopeptide transporter
MNAAASERRQQNNSFRTLFLIEMWERFGYYGMAALLVLFMVQELGFDDARANLTWGAFTALVYASPAIGGWLGDRVLGTRRSMTMGAVILALGYALLSVPTASMAFLYTALGVVVVGNGLFKSNAANLVRRIYEGDDARIDSAFTIYYMAVNIGSTASILLTPVIRTHFGWHAGFVVCLGGMLVGLTNYWFMRRTLIRYGSTPDNEPVHLHRLLGVLAGAAGLVAATVFLLQHRDIAVASFFCAGLAIVIIFGYMIGTSTPDERSGLIAVVILTTQTILFFIFYQQMSTSLTLFALRNVEWEQTLFGFTLFTWQPAQYQALNPIWIMVLSPILAWWYSRQGQRGRDWPIAGKFALGFAVVAIGFGIFGASQLFAHQGKVSSWLMIWGYGFYSLGELLVSGLGLAMISRYVPLRMSGFMMGAYFVGTGISQYLGSVVANFASVPHDITDPVATLTVYTRLFLVLGGVAFVGTLMALCLLPVMKRLSAIHSSRNSPAIDLATPATIGH